ncbi:MAG: HEPN domain-containing protein [Planctomycetota bacterium]|jgi:uncharacterized protein (UPF0332 family)|nr:HEPN domain-containing protein [Planctomycetota bacterium]
MNELAHGFWEKAVEALKASRHDLPVSAEAAASRAYYAALYAVSALFAERGRIFKKHTAIQTAVHRDLVKAGEWSGELGEGYSFLLKLRGTGDYSALVRVTSDEAEKAVKIAADILKAVAEANPSVFRGLFE